MKNCPNIFFCICVCVLFFAENTFAQKSIFDQYKQLLAAPKGYVCYKTNQPIVIDGKLNDNAWENAPFTDFFVDIEGDAKPLPTQQTRVKMLWDDDYLYIGAELREKHIWATLHQRDTIVYHDNDFEVFIDPDGDAHNYYEFEVNALGTVFDLFLTAPYRKRGAVLFHWDFQDTKYAIDIQGTLNNPNDKDTLWTVEMAIPKTDVRFDFNNPLQAGKYWRINFSRVQWDTFIENGRYAKVKDENGKIKPENNWVWSPQGKIDMHLPERWGYLYFSSKGGGDETEKFFYPPYETGKAILWAMFYTQEDAFSKNKKYFTSPAEFGFQHNRVLYDNQIWTIEIETTSRTFEISATSDDGKKKWIINQLGRIWER